MFYSVRNFLVQEKVSYRILVAFNMCFSTSIFQSFRLIIFKFIMKKKYATLFFILLEWYLGSINILYAQKGVFIVDSLKLNISYVGSFLHGSSTNKGYYLTNNQIFSYQDAILNTLPINILEKEPDFRGIALKKNIYLFNYPNYVLKIDTITKKEKKLKIVSKHKGKEYDIITLNANSLMFIEEENVMLAYIVPIGDEKENMYNSVQWYNGSIIGVFKVKGSTLKLSNIICPRSDVFHQNKYLPYLQWVRFFYDTKDVYVSQEPTYIISKVNLKTGLVDKFGEKGHYDKTDTFFPITSIENTTPRKELAYRYLSTEYSDIYVDSKKSRVFRIYSPGVNYSFNKDSLNNIVKICANDAYFNLIQKLIFETKKSYLQVYELKGSSKYGLVIDTLIPSYVTEITNVEGEVIYFKASPKLDKMETIIYKSNLILK